MGDLLISVLSIFADYSNVFSVFIILICFFTMSVFILRLNGDHLANRTSLQPGSYIPVQAMYDVQNPFVLKFTSSREASLLDGAELSITSQTDFHLCVFWGADIAETFHLMNNQWPDIVDSFRDGTLLQNHCLYAEDAKLMRNCDELQYKLKPPGAGLDLGDPPRSRYPLVVILFSPELEDAQVLDGNVVGMIITLFHMKDEVCSGESHIIGQYVRTAPGRPYNLKQLYMTTDIADQSTAPPHQPAPAQHEEIESYSNDCVICQTQSVSRVLLPCRHACVCNTCFLHLERCPICRSVIQSHFSLSPEDMEIEEDMTEENENTHWFYRLNNRINSYLGFT